jgi:hypothetical protein
MAIWKTTTSPCNSGEAFDNSTYVDLLAAQGLRIFDAFGITRNVSHHNSPPNGDGVCLDGLHYFPFVYRELNKELLSFLFHEEDNRR